LETIMPDPELSEPQYVIDARTMDPGNLAKKYPAVRAAYQTAKKRATKDGNWAFKHINDFLLAVGPRSSLEHSVDRFPRPTGPYAPGNVRWATPKEQANNRTTNKHVTVSGETLTYAEAGERFEVPADTIRKRKDRGWSDHDAVTGKRSSTPAPEPEDPSLIPAPPDRQSRFAYVPRMPTTELPLNEWPFPPDISAEIERRFQNDCEAGGTRLHRLRRQLCAYEDRIKKHYEPLSAEVRGRLEAAEEHMDEPDPETGETAWRCKPEKQAAYQARYDQLTAEWHRLAAEQDDMLAPFLALRHDADTRDREDRLPRFWRAVARDARSRRADRLEGF
jgi:hypothetical protein